ncbi:ribonuclease H-like domain-containing protein [Tanacetum coccineum]
MTGSDASQVTLLSDKLSLVTHHHLLTRVPVKLDLDDWNYGSWEYFFDQLCSSYDVSQYIHVVARAKSAKESWKFISDIVKDNKRSRTSALKMKLRSITLGDLTLEAYFQKIESLMTILASLDSPVNDEDVVHYVLAVPWPLHLLDSSSHMAFMTESGNPRRSSSSSQIKPWKPCFNFAKGTCRFGDGCRFVHDATMKNTNNHGVVTKESNTDEILAKLLARLGMNNTMVSTAHMVASPTTVSAQQPSSGPTAIPVGVIGPTAPSEQATILPNAFIAETLHDPTTGAWNMDTGASSHLNSSVSILVTNTGHSILSTPTKSLHLNNVLIIPHIVKNLIYVHQFVRDNNCTVEFDAFGFSVKDFMARRVLL